MGEQDSSAVGALLRQAVALHQRGQLDAARSLYEQVLEIAPRQFDALHLLGVIARQEGQAERAVELIGDAIAIDPAHAGSRCNLGAALQDLGQTAQALESYEAALRLDPNYALACCNRGNALRKLGRLNEALRSYERALALRPDYPEAWCNRAMLLQDLGRSSEALDSAERALAARATHADAWVARGNALQSLEHFAEAVESYDRALALNDQDAQAHCARGTALKHLHDLEGALLSYERAIDLKPDYATAHHYRANTLRALGRKDEAIAAYERALALGADAEQIAFSLAALGVGQTPAGSPASYVRELFDQYANRFDRHLVEALDYRTPALLDAALQRTVEAGRADVLDLGCGTGLMAPFLRARADRLMGVDLSEKMLEKARERDLYDELACAEIGAFLAAREDAYDVVVAADVFVYFGELETVFAQVHRAVRGDACFCFSVEAGAEADFTLRPSNRFAHSLAYLTRLAEATGFAFVQAEQGTLRTDNGVEVIGYLVVLRALKPGSAARLRWRT
jgi:predicted TPR repeat methyltransferase